MTDKEVMQMALDVMLAAIKAGDWKVDGACDPDYVLEALRARLSQCDRCGEVNSAEIHTCTPQFNPDWDAMAVMVEEQQRMAKRIDELENQLAQPEQEPVAWRTFDGEGGYDYRSYELNEDYDKEWLKRNPNHKGWVEPLYKDPTPCQTCEALARTAMMDQTSHDKNKEWVGLTELEVSKIGGACFSLQQTAEALEQALKEKNGY
jgi:RNA polymerase subunit RPABC4/transcription elongation factor Spt4